MSRGRCETTGKKRYRDLDEAAWVALRATRARGGTLRPYVCPDCQSWHLTSWTPEQQAVSGKAGS